MLNTLLGPFVNLVVNAKNLLALECSISTIDVSLVVYYRCVWTSVWHFTDKKGSSYHSINTLTSCFKTTLVIGEKMQSSRDEILYSLLRDQTSRFVQGIDQIAVSECVPLASSNCSSSS